MKTATRDRLLKEMGVTPWRLRPQRQEESQAPAGEPRQTAAHEVAASATTIATPPAAHENPLPLSPPSATMPAPPADERARRIAQLSWDDFAADVEACTACALCKTRHRSVPGVGDVRARWLFVGEGPGAEEDRKGEPFVGQAGRLLDQMLAALGLKRGGGVYIANVLKCRPPNNRAPTPQEADACRPYLERQIALIEPQLIVALGKSAAALLLATDASIASLRGRVHHYRGVPLVVTYHPAYLLRTPTDKAKSWEDLLFAKAELQETANRQ